MKLAKIAVAVTLAVGITGIASAQDAQFAAKTSALCTGIMMAQKDKTNNPKFQRAANEFNARAGTFIGQGIITRNEFVTLAAHSMTLYQTTPNNETVVSVTNTCNDMANKLGYFR
jgi:hypothetical protein